ncbi:MAG: DUF2062 domain-containing protein [Cyanobacteria bacterium SW_9_44_58]|nr:MAG: DUF2062 domain-containing protein [Cyanobacteria bacterium SW_9_44_58]
MHPTDYLHKKKKQSWWKRRLRYLYLRLIRLRSTTPAIARGLATGVFAGLFPFFGFQTIIGIGLAMLVRGNKLTAAVGTWISNPFTYVPVYLFNFQVGQLVLGTHDLSTDVDWTSSTELLQAGKLFIATLLVGCTVMGAIAGITAYFLSLWLIPLWRKQ